MKWRLFMWFRRVTSCAVKNSDPGAFVCLFSFVSVVCVFVCKSFVSVNVGGVISTCSNVQCICVNVHCVSDAWVYDICRLKGNQSAHSQPGEHQTFLQSRWEEFHVQISLNTAWLRKCQKWRAFISKNHDGLWCKFLWSYMIDAPVTNFDRCACARLSFTCPWQTLVDVPVIDCDDCACDAPFWICLWQSIVGVDNTSCNWYFLWLCCVMVPVLLCLK